jgi:RNA polymerase sigma-32 factor
VKKRRAKSMLPSTKPQIKTLQEEQIALWRSWRSGNARAFDALYASLRGLLCHYVKPYWQRGFNMDDLMSVATEGLLHGLHLYSDTHGTGIPTYVIWWVRAYVREFVVREGSHWILPRPPKGAGRALKKAQEIGSLDVAALVEAGVSECVAIYIATKSLLNVQSIDAHFVSDENQTRFHAAHPALVDSKPLADEQLIEHEITSILKSSVTTALGNLTDHQRMVMQELLDDPTKTMVDCAEARGISRQAVDHTCKAARKSMRRVLETCPVVSEEFRGCVVKPKRPKVAPQMAVSP